MVALSNLCAKLKLLIFISLDYVSDIKSTMFQSTIAELNELTDSYKQKEPEPLNRQFENRKTKADAISHHLERKQKVTVLFPPGNAFFEEICARP